MFVSPRLTTLLALLLAAVLVMTQTLGVVHGMTHGQSGSALHSHADNHDHHHADVHDEAGGSSRHFLSALFSLHEEASDCRLYDQASHDGALVSVMPLVLPVVPPPFSVAIFQGEALARWAALFDARGPPLTV
ncbi:MAG: hypothetical protein HQ446_05140 [Polaromonas sp.]|nr:hypothetical protein [Polaromonas sp.]